MTNKKFAEMTQSELADWWFQQDRSVGKSMLALRDAIRAEADADHREAMMRATREADRADETAVHWKREAERAERERDAFEEMHNRAVQSLRTAESALATEREDNRNLAAQIEAINGRAESALGEAKREGAREALWLLESEVAFPRYAEEIRAFRDREYPATPSGVTEDTDLSECERLASEIRHWVDDTVPQPALALMLSAMHNLEQAVAALANREGR